MSELFKPIWPTLFVLFVVGLWIFVWTQSWKSWSGLFETSDGVDKSFGVFLAIATTLLSVFLGFLALTLGRGLSAEIGSTQPQKWVQYWSADIVSIRNADGETGSISAGVFLIARNIGQSSTYFYYIKTSDGGFRQKSWASDNDTTVYEEDRTDGRVVQYEEKFKNPIMNWFGIPGDRVRMDFHVPKGSIQKQFELN